MATSCSRSFKSSSEDCRGKGDAGAAVAAIPVMAPKGLRYVARQPILDVRGYVHGYELLFRSGPTALVFDGDGDSATRTVLDNTVIFGLEKLTGGLPMFVNCTQESLLKGLVKVLPPEQTVLELLETLDPTPALLEACRELKELGFRLALDDFIWKTEWKPFLALADYVKVDLSTTTDKQRAELIGHLSRQNGQAALLVAERVETLDDLALARSEGFTLFQGYYFCRPVLLENREVPANRLVHLEMLQAVHEHPLDTRRVSSLVKLDPSLTYRLLRMVNSPLYGVGKVVSSIHGALVLIGDEMFRRVAMLAIAGELNGDHPSELLRMAFSRARFCELAATVADQDPTEQYLMGILSLLPTMLSLPMESILKTMPLREVVRQALLGHSNAESAILEWLVAYELGEWERCDEVALEAGLRAETLPQLYAEALLWTENIMSVATE
jgi:EAL and modified HD-GYP domain-containing signal transduction protein